MKLSVLDKEYMGSLIQNWGWFLFWGILLVILGILAISFSVFTTMTTVIFIGMLFLITGIIVLIDSFKFWQPYHSEFFIHLLMGLIYTVIGIIFIAKPVLSAVTITMILGVGFIVLGILRLIQTFSMRLLNKGWRILNGIITLLLGVLILLEWPASGLFMLGIFVGIELLMLGWLYIIASLGARRLA